jgi:hypothetical protein
MRPLSSLNSANNPLHRRGEKNSLPQKPAKFIADLLLATSSLPASTKSTSGFRHKKVMPSKLVQKHPTVISWQAGIEVFQAFPHPIRRRGVRFMESGESLQRMPPQI